MICKLLSVYIQFIANFVTAYNEALTKTTTVYTSSSRNCIFQNITFVNDLKKNMTISERWCIDSSIIHNSTFGGCGEYVSDLVNNKIILSLQT